MQFFNILGLLLTSLVTAVFYTDPKKKKIKNLLILAFVLGTGAYVAASALSHRESKDQLETNDQLREEIAVQFEEMKELLNEYNKVYKLKERLDSIIEKDPSPNIDHKQLSKKIADIKPANHIFLGEDKVSTVGLHKELKISVDGYAKENSAKEHWLCFQRGNTIWPIVKMVPEKRTYLVAIPEELSKYNKIMLVMANFTCPELSKDFKLSDTSLNLFGIDLSEKITIIDSIQLTIKHY